MSSPKYIIFLVNVLVCPELFVRLVSSCFRGFSSSVAMKCVLLLIFSLLTSS